MVTAGKAARNRGRRRGLSFENGSQAGIPSWWDLAQEPGVGDSTATMKTHLNRAWMLIVLAGLPLAGCKSHRSAHAPTNNMNSSAAMGEPAAPAKIVLDGDTSEWPGDAVIAANEHYVYVRFTVEDQQYTLQASPTTTAIMLDVDGDATTGRTSDVTPLNTMGVDLEIDFSPHNRNAAGHGVVVYAIDNAGHRTPLSTADVDFACAPTYASSWYECRISRTPD